MNESASDEKFLDCPFASIQKVVRGKWSMAILYFLSQRVLRFGELNRKMLMVTQAYLTKELRLLEEYGLVNRKVYPPVPSKVEHALTPLGEKSLPVLKAWENFAVDYQDYQA
ncbi:winged helix-turn-helix transcriptional regulator [Lactiplantibacillus plantarum]|uniref:Transcriptional regulator, HxlR family n=1 Tax=Lactiplantibacillus plantarum CMPG5300 TaxID=1304889 RepID=A0AAW3FLC6_LACPN|nr:helix-turn-helix domain-containing protein [Lactiplantibacillus plantarum]ATI72456.1 transcriptional regulator [Lactiplantibacillus plantarum]KGH41903.1 transcriptional regulator, HxlR family [Lactiplantibacillus plantarum CMPG5300]MBS0950844.1 helix-turn-helix transcriptional regulator [Lactiplantibacillus plantarum]MCZ2139568.1 helix-turn-helix transcriptional regulator [Lactiplantibacillus plantarum]MCZ2275462.1 helix-turn-helix transcriptional regulator [Lactiplantibacillus plantarum]